MSYVIPTMENFKKLIKDKKTVIFGAGEYCMRFLNRLDDTDLESIEFIVGTMMRNNMEITLFGIGVFSPAILRTLKPTILFVVIAIENGIAEVYKQLSDIGEFLIISARILMSDILSQVAKELYEGKAKIAEVIDLLYDVKSRWIYKEAIRRRMLYGECDFTDLIIRGDAEYRVPILYSRGRPKDEIIVDCGAYNGDTLKKFVETYGYGLKKIYAFECMDESIKLLKKAMDHVGNKKYSPQMVLMPYALSDHDCKMKFAKTNKSNGSYLLDNRPYAQYALWETEYDEVEVTTSIKLSPKTKLTFIKME
jgi:FkbM family methyltransferase